MQPAEIRRGREVIIQRSADILVRQVSENQGLSVRESDANFFKGRIFVALADKNVRAPVVKFFKPLDSPKESSNLTLSVRV